MKSSRIQIVLRERYGLEAVRQEVLGGEIDHNVKIVTDDGREFLVKATKGSIEDVGLRWQAEVLAHLAERVPEVPVSRLVPSRSGQSLVADGPYVVRLLTWLPGSLLVAVDHHPPELLTELGTVAGRLTQALADLPPRDGVPSHHWDVRKAGASIELGLGFVEDEQDRRNVERVLTWFSRCEPRFTELPMGVVHHDINDFNVLALPDGNGGHRISGVLDVGDALFTIRVAEVAIAAAYAMLRKEDPLAAATAVVAGFHSVVPLTAVEIAMIFPLAAARLCVNATTWTHRTAILAGLGKDTDDGYGKARMRHTWPAIARIAEINPALAEATFRKACGLDQYAPMVTPGKPAFSGPCVEIDLAPESDLYDDREWTDVAEVERAIAVRRGTAVGFSPHLRPSMLAAQRRSASAATVQLGVRLFAAEGEVLRTPLDAVVERVNPLILRHQDFWSCWWSVDSGAQVGDQLVAGDVLGAVQPGTQVQLLTADYLVTEPPPRLIGKQDVAMWAALSPDPAPLLGIEVQQRPRMDVTDIVSLRGRRFGRSQRAYYRRPMNLVRGRGVWLYDEDGLGYLDAINNVTHVGHAEPRVSAAAARQMRKLNTNSRFVYEGIAAYADRLCATLPDPLEVAFLVCTGSEANDLALRIARQVTGREDVMVIDGAYHGNTTAVTAISPNRYKGPGGTGAPPTTHEVMRPDRYRGPYGYDDPDAGTRYAADVSATVSWLVGEGRPPAAFIAESLMGTAGNIILPDGYLRSAFAAVRAAGGLCISDEVQVGVGRLGDSFWGFQPQGVVPDIVTMGKPLGNGHPIAAVVTTREIADAFDTGMKYFNTFGGNPVSCAIGQTVLDIVQGDGLQAHAAEVGAYFLRTLEELGERHELIGDVRGQGLYLGVELVGPGGEPAAAETMAVSEAMKDRGVIVYPNGVHDNVLKLKPPMIFGREHVDIFAETLDEVLLTVR